MSEALEPAGQRIAGRYEVLERLGRGAFGETLLARDLREDGRLVAIKRLHPERAEGWKQVELFEREAAVLRSLRHRGVPAIYEAFQEPEAGRACLVMEYIEGRSLARIIEEHAHLDPAEALQLLLGLLDILDYLHSRLPPVLHRDLKPANVIVRTDGSAALVDFGSVRSVFRAADEAGSTVVGTYGYMPFEQYMGQASPASDLYSLGASFLHLLSGRPPAEFLTPEGRLRVPAGLPGGELLRGVLSRLLEPALAERFSSAKQVRQALLGGVLGPNLPVRAERPLPERHPAPREVLELGEAPRDLSGPAGEAFRRVVTSPWRLMFPGLRPGEPLGAAHRFVHIAGTLGTLGILPAVYTGVYWYRKRRYRPFFLDGHLAEATILAIKTMYAEWPEVSYEFQADGKMRRGADKIAPGLARYWHAGDSLHVLYLPQRAYDSVIISTA